MIWYLYILQTTHLSHIHYLFFSKDENFKNFSYHFQIYNTLLLTIVTMVDIIPPWLFHFITRSLYLLTNFVHLILLPSPPIFGKHQYILYLWACFFFFLDSTHNIQSVPCILGSKLSPLTCSISMMPHMWKLSHT